jgi:predicted O-linked N-acetylglucosamine transferase (SPINDLY family)
MSMPNPDQLLRQAQLWHQQGQLPQAESAYRQILAQAPQHAYALHYLGLLLAQQQHYAEALPLLVQSCQQQPGNWSFFTNLGEAQRRAGELENAQKSCRQALFLKPDFAEAHFNLANLLKQLGQFEDAVGHYQVVLKTQPQQINALFNLGLTHRQLGQDRLAMAAFEKAVKLKPDYAEAHNNLGAGLEEFYELEEALKHYQFAFWLKPDFSEALANIAHVQEALGYVDEAHRTLQQLRVQEPDNLVLHLSQAGMFSSVPFSNYEIDNFRQRLFSTLQNILEADQGLDLLKEDRINCQPSMELPYHGRDDRPLKEAYAKIYGKYLPSFDPRPRHTGKQKIGFVVTSGHESVFIKCMAGILQGFSLVDCELTMVCSQPNGVKILQPALNRPEIQYLELPNKIAEAVSLLQSAQFDLLYYWEVGTDSLNYFLPYFRLARVQCTSWGWPVTSGIPNLDYFISMAGVETLESDSHYSEKLIRLPHLATGYRRPPLPAILKPRDAFALPPEAHWYICTQNVSKIQPDYDQLVAEVLRQDSQGILLITASKHAPINRQLLRRFQAFHPDVVSRIHVLPRQPECDYLNLIAHSQVVLDTLYYTGGANTTLDAFACGTPVITLPTRFHRGRFTAAAYEQIGLNSCVALDTEDYIAKAIQLGTDPASRRQISQELVEASAELFEDPRPAKELEDCLLSLCQA